MGVGLMGYGQDMGVAMMGAWPEPTGLNFPLLNFPVLNFPILNFPVLNFPGLNFPLLNFLILNCPVNFPVLNFHSQNRGLKLTQPTQPTC